MLAIAAPGSAVFVFFVFLHQWVKKKTIWWNWDKKNKKRQTSILVYFLIPIEQNF